MQDLLFNGVLCYIRAQNEIGHQMAYSLVNDACFPVGIAAIAESFLFVHEDVADAVFYHRHEVPLTKKIGIVEGIGMSSDTDMCGSCESPLFGFFVIFADVDHSIQACQHGLWNIIQWLFGDYHPQLRIARNDCDIINCVSALNTLKTQILMWRKPVTICLL